MSLLLISFAFIVKMFHSLIKTDLATLTWEEGEGTTMDVDTY